MKTTDSKPFLIRGEDYKEWIDPDIGLNMWELTVSGKEKARRFKYLADLWLKWFETPQVTDENLVDPWTMGIYD